MPESAADTWGRRAEQLDRENRALARAVALIRGRRAHLTSECDVLRANIEVVNRAIADLQAPPRPSSRRSAPSYCRVRRGGT